MATVKLSTFYKYRPTQRPTIISLDDVPMPFNMLAPDNGLTTLFGNRDALEEQSRQVRRLEEEGYTVDSVTIEVEVGDVSPGRVVLKRDEDGKAPLLTERRFVYMDRLGMELVHQVTEIMRKFYEDEKIPFESGFSRAGFIARHPHLIGRLARSPLFQHVDIFVYRIWDEDLGSARQIATIFNDRGVQRILSTRRDVRIELPNRIRRSGENRTTQVA
jgi:hypothetical protein